MPSVTTPIISSFRVLAVSASMTSTGLASVVSSGSLVIGVGLRVPSLAIVCAAEAS